MLKTITRVGNSQGVIFDAALMDLARLRVGDQVDITLAPGGSLIFTPIRHAAAPEIVHATIKETVRAYRKTLRRLA